MTFFFVLFCFVKSSIENMTVFKLNIVFKVIFKIFDIVDLPEPCPPAKPIIFGLLSII